MGLAVRQPKSSHRMPAWHARNEKADAIGLSQPALSAKGSNSVVTVLSALLTWHILCSRHQPCYYLYDYTLHKEAEAELSEKPSFPALLYLDHDAFEQSPLEFPLPGLDVPPYVETEIGDFSGKRQIALQFFNSVHLWMPFISKQRFFNTLLSSPIIHQADVALLCLSMKLVMWLPYPGHPGCRPPLYLAARQYLYGVDISKHLTLPILQAAILIAIFEIGHAMYPAAHTSLSLCIEYAIALGLGWKTVRWGENNLPWVEAEERMRSWWAIVILERYVLN